MEKEKITIAQTIKRINDLITIIADIEDFLEENNNADKIPYKMRDNLRRIINSIFTEFKCRSLNISNNTDKEFFGMYIKYDFEARYLFAEEKEHFSMDDCPYDIDLDSKLFTHVDLSPIQITTCIIYDIYKIVSKDAIMSVNYALDAIANGRNDLLRKNSFEGFAMMQQILKFATIDYMHNSLSIFTRGDEDIVRVPEILEYTVNTSNNNIDDIIAAINVVADKSLKSLISPAIMLNWAVCVAKTYTPMSDDPIGVFNDIINYTGCDTIREWAFYIAKGFHGAVTKQWKNITEASLFTGIRKSGMKSIENDLFEYEMRMRNVQDEDSAIFLMRQINSRMSIIAEYLEEEKISENERKRWQNMYDRYEKLRYKMVSKPVYAKKMYGLYTDYNALSQASPENYMTMNTFY